MLIRMLSTAPGSVDGIRVACYEADQEYDLTATAGARALAAAFVGAGFAEEVGSTPAPTVEAEQVGEGDSQQASAPKADAETPPAKPGRKAKAQ